MKDAENNERKKITHEAAQQDARAFGRQDLPNKPQ